MRTKSLLIIAAIGLATTTLARAESSEKTFSEDDGAPLEFGPPPTLDSPASLPPEGWLFGEELPEATGVPENPDADPAPPSTVFGRILQWFRDIVKMVGNLLQNIGRKIAGT